MTVFKRTVMTVIVAVVLGAVIQCSRSSKVEDVEQAAQTRGLATVAVDLDDWRLDGEPAVYVGDTLYELIDGGAEVYHRFGFVQALAAQYSDDGGRGISLEVFEMRDVDGAQKIYSDKTGGSGDPIDIGDEGAGEDYYLNFRTGRYLVTITGFDSDAATTDGILVLARAVAEELGGER
jgi:hypothetical protein